jgi:acyl carrier protein
MVARQGVRRSHGWALQVPPQLVLETRGAMDQAQLRSQLKRLIVVELNLKGRDPETIEDDAPLFGAGLGLDSLDALQLAMCIEEKLGVRIPEGEEARPIFRSVRSLAEHVAKVRIA